MERHHGEDLFDAIKNGDAGRVTAILTGGIDPNLKLADILEPGHHTPNGMLSGRWIINRREPGLASRPIHWSCLAESISIARILINSGASINAADEYGMTPLHLAVSSCNEKLVNLLLQFEADVNQIDAIQGMTPLIRAYLECRSALPLLINAGANLNTSSLQNGHNVLHYAVIAGDVELTRRLLLAGANPAITTADGETAFELARRFNHPDIEHLLCSDTFLD